MSRSPGNAAANGAAAVSSSDPNAVWRMPGSKGGPVLSSAGQMVTFSPKYSESNVIIHKDYLRYYSPVVRRELFPGKKVHEGSQEKYKVKATDVEPDTLLLLSQWIYTGRFENSITYNNSLSREKASNSRSKEDVELRQWCMFRLWTLAKELEIAALQKTAILQIQRLARKYLHLNSSIFLSGCKEMQNVCVDIWICIILSGEKSDLAEEDISRSVYQFLDTDMCMEGESELKALHMLIAAMINRGPQLGDVWENQDEVTSGQIKNSCTMQEVEDTPSAKRKRVE
ncbi:hypothetical protein B0J14DRAFT_656097 [Halenospora varia]|nr:hypothetical protein B0J14DRAFT_656097 [Halenospora varia]